jgi:hypothetical protein
MIQTDALPKGTRVSLDVHAFVMLLNANNALRRALPASHEPDPELVRAAQEMSAAMEAVADGGCWVHPARALPRPHRR